MTARRAATLLAIVATSCARQPEQTTTAPNPRTHLRFEDGTSLAGIDFVHVPARTPQRYMPEIMGSGVALVDVNRDGAPDLVLVNGGALTTKTRPEDARTRLYLNDGKGKFSDRTEAWKLPSRGYGMGVAAGDFDGDGWTDLFLTSYGGDDALLRNTGTTFEDVTASAGIRADGGWSTGAGFFDLENDGDLDLWTVRYVAYTPETDIKTYHGGQHVYSTPIVYDPVADRLLRNDGRGAFVDVSKAFGLDKASRKGLAIAIGDIDLDGCADLYVANDTNPNQLWACDGRGGLTESGQLQGVAYSEEGAEQGSMGADFSDTNGDGAFDIACTNFQGEATNIYRQERPRSFRDVADAIGIGETSRPRLKFGVDFFDADNDGDEDLLVANGHIEDNIEAITRTIHFAQPPTLYESAGDGTFTDATSAAGPALQKELVGRGLATGDVDGDGDLDFIVSTNGGPALLGLNATEPRGGYVSLWLEGDTSNRSAIGARVVAKIGERTLQRQVMGSSSYLSMCDLHVHIGTGKSAAIDVLTIHWPGAAPQTIEALPAGRCYRIVQGQAPSVFVPGEAVIVP